MEGRPENPILTFYRNELFVSFQQAILTSPMACNLGFLLSPCSVAGVGLVVDLSWLIVDDPGVPWTNC